MVKTIIMDWERQVANHYLRKRLEEANPLLKKLQDKDILSHLNLGFDICTYALWDSPITIRPNKNELDKVLEEYYTNPHTAMSPVINKKTNRPSIAHILNIIPNAGLTKSGQNWTGEATVSATHFAIGDTAGALPADTTMNNELVRKELATVGYRKVTNQTAIFAMLFSDADDTPPYYIREAGLLTAGAGGTLYVHSNTTEFQLTAGLFWSGKISITYASV